MIRSCDDPDAAPPPTCQTSGFCTMFVTGPLTSSSYGPGGVATMDAICNAASNRPSTTVTYKALVADGSTRIACTTAGCSTGTQEHVDWVLEPSREYRRADGTTVIGTTTEAGIFAFPLAASISDTISGTNAINTGILTTWISSSNNCAGWTSGAVGTSTQFGVHDDTSDALLSVGTQGCSNAAQLVCVEQ